MKLIATNDRFGRVEDDEVVTMGPDLVEYLRTGRASDGRREPLRSLRLGPPVRRPGKIIGIGLNYRDHAEETGQPVPDEPILFAKFANSIVGPGDDIEVPLDAREPDYEAELGVVIGRTARSVSPDSALDYVGGYLCCNDVSARDLQMRVGQWTRGKAVDTFLPCGPWLVTPDELGDPQDLRIGCTLNGEVMQESTTAQMVFGVAELVSFLSRTMTLEPGDLIATGTPPGVGFTRTPPRYLQDGDRVTVEIERIGSLTNTVRRPASIESG
jgi:2,4-diketo-3-deoxy-L-fuconate hydrolase